MGVANALAAQGCRIVRNDLAHAAEIEWVRLGLSRCHGIDVRYDGADLTDLEVTTSLVQGVTHAFRGADISVYNAGIQHTALINDFPAPTWNAVIAIMLSVSFHLILQIVACMKQIN